jgi:hypothetical protein
MIGRGCSPVIGQGIPGFRSKEAWCTKVGRWQTGERRYLIVAGSKLIEETYELGWSLHIL